MMPQMQVVKKVRNSSHFMRILHISVNKFIYLKPQTRMVL